jgi:hypothetical protein
MNPRFLMAMAGWIAFLLLGLCFVPAGADAGQDHRHQVAIPVLGTTMEEVPAGRVVYLVLTFEDRRDEAGLAVVFKSSPGRFSTPTQTAVEEAIYRVAHAMGVSPHSWTVVLSLPYAGVTIYGDSCTAMVALSVMVLANDRDIPTDRVITGTVTPDGRIGPVGGIPLKVTAANEAHLRRVLVSDEQDAAEERWETPFLMQVSPVGTVAKAYEAFIAHPSSP